MYTNNSVVVARRRGWGKKGVLIGDRRRSDFGWWAHGPIYRFCTLVIHMWTNVTPIKFNEKKFMFVL